MVASDSLASPDPLNARRVELTQPFIGRLTCLVAFWADSLLPPSVLQVATFPHLAHGPGPPSLNLQPNYPTSSNLQLLYRVQRNLQDCILFVLAMKHTFPADDVAASQLEAP